MAVIDVMVLGLITGLTPSVRRRLSDPALCARLLTPHRLLDLGA